MTAGQPGVCLPANAGQPCARPFVDHADVNGGGPQGQDNATADVGGGTMNGFVTEALAAKKGCAYPNYIACADSGHSRRHGQPDQPRPPLPLPVHPPPP